MSPQLSEPSPPRRLRPTCRWTDSNQSLVQALPRWALDAPASEEGKDVVSSQSGTILRVGLTRPSMRCSCREGMRLFRRRERSFPLWPMEQPPAPGLAMEETGAATPVQDSQPGPQYMTRSSAFAGSTSLPDRSAG